MDLLKSRLYHASMAMYHPPPMSRRSAWRGASHRMFFLFGLDPAGNIIFRFREGRPGRGGWFRCQHLHGAHVFPFHWAVGQRLVALAPNRRAAAAADVVAPSAPLEPVVLAAPPTPDVAGAVADLPPTTAPVADSATRSPDVNATTPEPTPLAGAEQNVFDFELPRGCFVDPVTNVLRIDPRISLYRGFLRRLRISNAATWAYKATYYLVWAFSLFLSGCMYLRFKTTVVGQRTRERLTSLEDAVRNVFDFELPRGCFVDPVTNVLRIDPRISLYRGFLRRLRISNAATWAYKATYYLVWAFSLFLSGCMYLRFKTTVVGQRTRERLTSLEDAVRNAVARIIPSGWSFLTLEEELLDIGVPRSAVDVAVKVYNALTAKLHEVAVSLGYDHTVAEKDFLQTTQAKLNAAKAKSWEQRRMAYWSIIAWLVTVFVAVFALMM
jgi:hypothetical protein